VRRLLAITIFALAAAGATLAGSGLIVAPHVDPPGTPLHHDHVLAAYRFPIFLMRLQQLYDREPEMVMVSPLATSLAVTVMALLVFAWPRLSRPALRPWGYVAQPLIARSLWRGPLLLGPPRA
jgi:hypothetical protein